MDKVSHMLRRSRLRSFAAAAHHALPMLPRAEEPVEIRNYYNETEVLEQVMKVALEKRLTQAEIEALQSSAKASAIKAASETAAAAAAAAKTSTSVAAVKTTAPTTTAAAQTTSHPAYVFSDKYGNAVTSTSAVTSASAVKSAAPSSSTPSSSVPKSSTVSSVAPSSSTPVSSAVATTSATPTVKTITQAASSTSSASASASQITGTDANAAAAAKSSSSSSGLSTGAIAGIVVAVLVGLVVVGSTIGWLYRKYSNRSYSTKTPWSKIDDDDITPFPPNEKLINHHDQPDDIYGNSPAPVIGSRRALALARQNAFNTDGSLRPPSDYMIERGQNRAGVGSGLASQPYHAYPSMPSPDYGEYAMDPQGRPYHPHAGRTPMAHMYQDLPAGSPHAITAPGNSRQLVGPGGPGAYPQPELSPMALGRPAPPSSNFAIAQHEDFADMPEPLTPTMGEHDSPYTPRTATTMGEWAGDARPPQNRSRVSMNTPRDIANTDAIAASRMSPTEMLRPPPPAAMESFPVAQPHSANTLPAFEPMSPLMSVFDLRRSSGQPLPMYEDEKSTQKRMYSEVATAAGVTEPPTPRSANLNESTNSTDSSFSAHEPMPRLPALTLNPPQPYVHGQPLSPLAEVATPLSTNTQATTATNQTMASSSAMHGQQLEHNPFERTLLPPRAALAPPYSASTTGATGFPSPAYPPPSPGGMSVPGSVSDSPRRWSGDNTVLRGRRESMFDGEDAYGGI